MLIVAHRPGVFEIYVPAREPRMPAVGMTAAAQPHGVSRAVEGRVIEVAPTVVEMPERLRSSTRRCPSGVAGSWSTPPTRDEMRAVPPGEEIRVRI